MWIAGLVVLGSQWAKAETTVFVQNNTPFSFPVEIVRPSGLALPGQYWKAGARYVNAGQRASIMTTNRDSGVKNGKYFEFHCNLSMDGSRFALKQRLRGSLVGSHLWQSVSGQSWYDDRNTHRANWSVGKHQFTILYRAYFTGGDDDIEYIIQYRYPTMTIPTAGINVLAYNTYMRPEIMFVNGQAQRAALMIPQIKNQGYEVIIFSELFDDSIRRDFLKGIRDEFPHHTSVVGSDGVIEQDGGVVIVSKYPIATQAQRLFGKASSGVLADKLSDKGVKYACVNKNGTKYHIFGSHTQADKGTTERNVRKQQFQIIRDFISSRNIPKNEAVIVGGDLNVDKKGSPSEYQDMVRILNAKEPMYLGTLTATWDPTINKCADRGTPEYLDYIFAIKGYREAGIYANEVRLHRSAREWKSLPTDRARWDLSDHFPVASSVYFKKGTVSVRPAIKSISGAPSKSDSTKGVSASSTTERKPVRIAIIKP
jgi:sphingomyelin phosphodiesterase